MRGTVLGFFLGILPGGGAVIASFASYAMEKKLSRTPERFGKGAIEGVAGPEAANNAAAGGAFIPLMTLGIPPNVVMALLLGAFIIHGMQPGPLMMTQKPASVLGHRRQHVHRQRHAAGAQHAADRHVGAGAEAALPRPVPADPDVLHRRRVRSGNAVFDVFVMIVFGVLGYLMRKFGYEPAPLVLAFVLGPMLENNLRKSLILSHGDFSIFVERPISAVCLVLAVAHPAHAACCPPSPANAPPSYWIRASVGRDTNVCPELSTPTAHQPCGAIDPRDEREDDTLEPATSRA